MSNSDKPVFATAGDFCIAGTQVESAYRDPAKSPWDTLRETIGDSIPVIANLECPITDSETGRPNKYANLRGGNQTAGLLSGLDAAILGNNHISDFGEQGVQDTLSVLNEFGVQNAGYGANLSEACRPLFLDLGKHRLGVISFCCPTTNGENLATHLSPGVAPMSMALLREAILDAKDQCDALLIYLHWGAEHVHDPVPDQIRVGRHAIECGADAVVGCHSHTIQSYERYRGRWIFYGLGNYLFGDLTVQRLLPDGSLTPDIHRQQSENRESLVVLFSIGPDRGTGRIALDQTLCFGFGPDYIPKPIARDQLTFDLDTANAKLTRYCARNAKALSIRDEPAFVCKVRKGILAYFYSKGPLAPLTTTGRLRKRLNWLFARAIASVRSIPPRLYQKSARLLQRI